MKIKMLPAILGFAMIIFSLTGCNSLQFFLQNNSVGGADGPTSVIVTDNYHYEYEPAEEDSDVTTESKEEEVSDAEELNPDDYISNFKDFNSDNTNTASEESTVSEDIDSAPAQEGTVEAFYSQPEVKASLDAQIASLKESYSDAYSDLGYLLDGNTFTYYYQYANQIPNADGVAEQLAGSITDEYMQGMINSITEECGIEDITLKYIFYNADGSIIYEGSYPE